jgi:hypothetical protein
MLTHFELCKLTAKRFAKDNWITLCDYQSYACDEFPDVLCFNGLTTLFEIKISRSDFLADAKKEHRQKWKPKGSWRFNVMKHMAEYSPDRPELWYIEAPHLGRNRYYVCESGLINANELPNGWGLYWVRGNRFYLQKKSGLFKRNIHKEINILAHAFRKYASGNGENIIVNKYEGV